MTIRLFSSQGLLSGCFVHALRKNNLGFPLIGRSGWQGGCDRGFLNGNHRLWLETSTSVFLLIRQ